MTALPRQAQVQTLLSRSGVDEPIVTMTSLKGGYLNDVLLARTASHSVVFKFFTDPVAGTLFPNLPDDEAEAARKLAPLDVAPALFGYWPDEGVIACDFVDAEWDGDLTSLARVLLRKEQADPTGFRQVAMTPEAILAAGDALFDLGAGLRPERPKPLTLPPPPRLSLIHTDIGSSNLLGRGEALRIIDWQCPAAGDLCEDIYSILSPGFRILNLDAPLAEAERAGFFAALDRPGTMDRYHRLEPFYAWRFAGYCAMRAHTHEDPAIRARYADALAAESELIHRLTHAD